MGQSTTLKWQRRSCLNCQIYGKILGFDGEALWALFAYCWLTITQFFVSVCVRCLDLMKDGRSAERPNDGREAVEKCKQLKPDLLILDICMPRLNGVDAARQVLRHNPGQKILVVTDVGSDQVIRDCLEAGVRG
jgi:Response regulator receiver domain